VKPSSASALRDAEERLRDRRNDAVRLESRRDRDLKSFALFPTVSEFAFEPLLSDRNRGSRSEKNKRDNFESPERVDNAFVFGGETPSGRAGKSRESRAFRERNADRCLKI